MKVRRLGHHGLAIATTTAHVLVNPWFAANGAFHASRFPYPDNAALAATVPRTPTAVVVTDATDAHCDLDFLAALPAAVPIFIPHAPVGLLRRKLAVLGRENVIALEPWEVGTIGESGGESAGRIMLVPEPGFDERAAVLVLADGQSVLDINSARLPALYARCARMLAGGTIDAVTVDVTAAEFTPLCFDDADAEKFERQNRRERRQRFEYAVQLLRMVQPRHAVTIAGSPCLLAPDLLARDAELAAHLVVAPTAIETELRERMMRGLVSLGIGDTLDTATGAIDRTGAEMAWGNPWADRVAYVTAYAERRRAAIEAELARFPRVSASSVVDAFRDYAQRLVSANPAFYRQINAAVGVDWIDADLPLPLSLSLSLSASSSSASPSAAIEAHGEALTLDFRADSVGVRPGLSAEVKYRVRMDARWVAAVLADATNWASVLDSLRVSIWRDSNVRKDHFLTLLRAAQFGPESATDTVKTALKAGEWVRLPSEDGPMFVERYCPHAQLDLLDTGEIAQPGILRCIAHAYEFSLANGACINAACRPLQLCEQPQ